MKISVNTHPNYNKNLISYNKETKTYHIFIKKPAIKGMANKELIKILSEYFNTSKYNIKIIKGITSRKKIIDILN